MDNSNLIINLFKIVTRRNDRSSAFHSRGLSSGFTVGCLRHVSKTELEKGAKHRSFFLYPMANSSLARFSSSSAGLFDKMIPQTGAEGGGAPGATALLRPSHHFLARGGRGSGNLFAGVSVEWEKFSFTHSLSPPTTEFSLNAADNGIEKSTADTWSIRETPAKHSRAVSIFKSRFYWYITLPVPFHCRGILTPPAPIKARHHVVLTSGTLEICSPRDLDTTSAIHCHSTATTRPEFQANITKLGTIKPGTLLGLRFPCRSPNWGAERYLIRNRIKVHALGVLPPRHARSREAIYERDVPSPLNHNRSTEGQTLLIRIHAEGMNRRKNISSSYAAKFEEIIDLFNIDLFWTGVGLDFCFPRARRPAASGLLCANGSHFIQQCAWE